MARRETPAADKEDADLAALVLGRLKSGRTTPDDVRILSCASVLSRTAPWAFRANLLVKVATATGNSLRGCASETVSGEKRDACSQREETHACGCLSVRVEAANHRHHIWRNNGVWWTYDTLHFDGRKRRVRRSLKTRHGQEAVCRRDELFKRLGQEGEAVPERSQYGVVDLRIAATTPRGNAATSCCRGRAVTGGQP